MDAITLPRAETHECLVTDMDDRQLECRFEVCLYEGERPEIRLKSVVYESFDGKVGGGVECRSAVELSRFIVLFRKLDFSENLCWQFIEQRCRELYALDCTRITKGAA